MPFAMIHLSIAKRILERTNEIREPHQFLLGALAPDAVHFIDDYSSDMKLKSHFCVGDEAWGCVTNNAEWLENIIWNIERFKNSRNRDFYLGYFTHIITDIQNNIKVWLPFKGSIKDCNEPGIGKAYHRESNQVDIKLFHEADSDIRELVNRAQGVEIGILKKDIVEQSRDSFLNERFKNTSLVDCDVSKNNYVKMDEVYKFIEDESRYISSILFGAGDDKK